MFSQITFWYLIVIERFFSNIPSKISVSRLEHDMGNKICSVLYQISFYSLLKALKEIELIHVLHTYFKCSNV